MGFFSRIKGAIGTVRETVSNAFESVTSSVKSVFGFGDDETEKQSNSSTIDDYSDDKSHRADDDDYDDAGIDDSGYDDDDAVSYSSAKEYNDELTTEYQSNWDYDKEWFEKPDDDTDSDTYVTFHYTMYDHEGDIIAQGDLRYYGDPEDDEAFYAYAFGAEPDIDSGDVGYVDIGIG